MLNPQDGEEHLKIEETTNPLLDFAPALKESGHRYMCVLHERIHLPTRFTSQMVLESLNYESLYCTPQGAVNVKHYTKVQSWQRLES
jgi:hypothetical protein